MFGRLSHERTVGVASAPAAARRRARNVATSPTAERGAGAPTRAPGGAACAHAARSAATSGWPAERARDVAAVALLRHGQRDDAHARVVDERGERVRARAAAAAAVAHAHEAADRADDARGRLLGAAREQGVQVVLLAQRVAHRGVAVHQPDADDAPRLPRRVAALRRAGAALEQLVRHVRLVAAVEAADADVRDEVREAVGGRAAPPPPSAAAAAFAIAYRGTRSARAAPRERVEVRRAERGGAAAVGAELRVRVEALPVDRRAAAVPAPRTSPLAPAAAPARQSRYPRRNVSACAYTAPHAVGRGVVVGLFGRNAQFQRVGERARLESRA